MSLYVEAAASYERRRWWKHYFDTLVQIGLLYEDLGRPDSARAQYEAVLRIRRENVVDRMWGVDREREASMLRRIGGIFQDLGRPDSALAYYRDALTVVREMIGWAVEQEAIILHEIGIIYSDLGRPDSALAYLRAAQPLRDTVGDIVGIASTRAALGSVYAFDLGQADSGLAYYRLALATQHVYDHRGEATTLHNTGAFYAEVGQPDSALAYFRAALPIRREFGDRVGEATTLSRIGRVHANLGRPDSALFYYRAALPIHRDVRDPSWEARTLGNFGELYSTSSGFLNLGYAVSFFDSAAAISAAIRESSGGEANRIAFAEDQAALSSRWTLAWLARNEELGRGPVVGAALAAAERGRAQALLDVLRRTADSAEGSSGLGSYLTMPGADLAIEADRFLDPLRQSHTAALSYLIARDTLLVWLLTPEGNLLLAARTAMNQDSLNLLVHSLRVGLGADSARGAMVRGGAEQEDTRGLGLTRAGGFDRAATVLADLLLPKNLLASVPVGAELVIVPHGVLSLVPFALLPAGSTAEPLGLQYALRYAPSLTSLAAIGPSSLIGTARADALRRALVVGDPAMPSVTTSEGRSISLRRLPAAQQEGNRIAARLGTTSLTGVTASETTIRDRLSQAPLVHLATHGLAYGTEARVRDSYVALAPDSLNDGLLTLGELVDDPTLSLSADLVVLSACQTGLGNLRYAEGTVGLQRGLLARGARSVLVSLWSVDDQATALLMDRFYEHWLKDRDTPGKAEALRRAQMDVRKQPSFRHPRYWAAFQLVGAN